MKATRLSIPERIMDDLQKNLPNVFSRKYIFKHLGGAISVGTLANAASGGYGPPCIRKGRNAIYERESFLEWFKVYLEGGLKKVKTVYYQRE